MWLFSARSIRAPRPIATLLIEIVIHFILLSIFSIVAILLLSFLSFPTLTVGLLDFKEDVVLARLEADVIRG